MTGTLIIKEEVWELLTEETKDIYKKNYEIVFGEPEPTKKITIEKPARVKKNENRNRR